MGDSRGGRARDDVSGSQRRLLDFAPAGPQLERRRALQDDEDLLLGGVAVRDAAPVARRDLLPVKAGERRAFARREGRGGHQAFVLLVLDLVDVDDVPGPRRRLADRERLDGRLDLPRVVVAPLYPAPAEPDCAGPRQPAQLRRMARAEDEVLEPIWPRDECVLHLIRAVDDTVEWSHLVHVSGLPREPRAGEDEVQLLGRAVRVGRRRQPAGSDAYAVDADAAGASRVAEPLPLRIHLAFGHRLHSSFGRKAVQRFLSHFDRLPNSSRLPRPGRAR